MEQTIALARGYCDGSHSWLCDHQVSNQNTLPLMTAFFLTMGLWKAKGRALSILSDYTGRVEALPTLLDVVLYQATLFGLQSLATEAANGDESSKKRAQQTLQSLSKLSLFVVTAGALYQLPQNPVYCSAQLSALGFAALGHSSLVPTRLHSSIRQTSLYAMKIYHLLWAGWIPRLLTAGPILLPPLERLAGVEFRVPKGWDGEEVGREFRGSLDGVELAADESQLAVRGIAEGQTAPIQVQYLLFLAEKRNELAQERLAEATSSGLSWKFVQLALGEELGLPIPEGADSELGTLKSTCLNGKFFQWMLSDKTESIKREALSNNNILLWTLEFLKSADQDKVVQFLRERSDVDEGAFRPVVQCLVESGDTDKLKSVEQILLFPICAGSLKPNDHPEEIG